MNSDSIEVTLHDSQALIQIINANVTYAAWQRGGGKTGGGMGPRIQRLSEVMPRSQILLFSDTYKRLKERIVPNIIFFLEKKFGWVEGIDYVKYKRPPEHWAKPLIPLDIFENVISCSNGCAFCLVSLAVEGSGNAFNAQAAIGDEVKYCDEEKINSEVLPALRGAEEYFGHLPEYLSVWMFTDKYGPKVKWFLRKKKLMNERAVEMVYVMQMQILLWKQEMQQYTSTKTIYEYKNKIDAYEDKLRRLRKNLVYFSDMKPFENKATLGEFFFKRARRISRSEYEFNVSFLNHDPDKVEHAYYPTFTKLNKYKSTNDYNPTLPFIGAMDYNFRISPLPVAQVSKLPNSIFETVNVIDYIWELAPNGIEDTVKGFCEKYKRHQNKEFHYVYDHTAIGRSPSKTTFRDIFINAFPDDWDVIEHPIGKAPEHDTKFDNFKIWLAKSGQHAIRVNELTCDTLIKAIEQTKAEIQGNITKKDKKSEKNPNFPAEESTHGPDAFDMLVWWVYEFDGVHTLSDETDFMKTN